MTKAQRTDFNDPLIDSVEETVREVLGAEVNPAFWFHYQAFLGISREEMPNRLDAFFASLKGTFGVGRDILGRLIVKKVYSKANVPFTYVPDKPLAQCLEELKQTLSQSIMHT